jgi:hypothetical protein
MVDDDEDRRYPSPEPRTGSRSGLPMKNRRWRWLRIIKHDETSSPGKIGGEFSSYFMIQSHRHLLLFIERPDLESVRGSGEGNPSSSSSSTILHHQFHDAHHRE